MDSGHAALKGWSLIFYGSKQPIDKNDPVSVPLIPLNTLYNITNANNQAASVTKSNNGGKGNRKQQQQQQQKSSSQSNGSQQTGRKNGKNQSGNKNWKQRVTSPRPLTTLLSGRDRNKFDPLNGISFTSKTTTTTVRPIKLSNNNVDNKNVEKTVYIKSPAKAPKQVKEIVAAGSINKKVDSSNGSAVAVASAAASATKNSPNVPVIKSSVPKITTASPFDAHVEIVASFQYTSNPNIPKLFQRYEKIQEFYPEFHPYVLPKASSSGGGGSAGKPSRDGSKHKDFSFTSNHQSSSASVSAEISTSRSHEVFAAQKPFTSRTQTSAVISSTNGKG